MTQDAEGLLASKTEPETGTTTYTYDAAYRLATKTDAKSQRAVYSYDGHGRIAMVQRYPVAGGAEDERPRTVYGYDTAENGVGRLARVKSRHNWWCQSGLTESYASKANGVFVNDKEQGRDGQCR